VAERALGVVPGGDGDPSQPPVAAARVLGAELRQLREDKNLRQRDVVEAGIVSSVSTLSRYETARTKLREETVLALFRFYGVTDPAELRRVRAQVKQSVTSEWWSEFRDVVTGFSERLFSMERTATEIHTFEAFFVPGLLQTPDYARAVFRAPFRKIVDELAYKESEEQVKRRLRFRMLRQQLLEDPQAPEYSALIDESVLSRPTGGRTVMRGQLRHLYNLCENKNRIHIRVLPFAAAAEVTALTPSITRLVFPPDIGGDLIYVEATNQGGTYVSDLDQVEAHKASLLDLWQLADDKRQTLALLQHYIDRLADTV
jgi:transcriptional regulator with XRE-family HTH domain